MKKISLAQIVFITTLFTLCTLFYFLFTRLQGLIDSYKWVNNTSHVERELERFMNVIKDAEACEQGYLLAQDPNYLITYQKSVQRYNAILTVVDSMTRQSATLQKKIKLMASITRHRENYLQKFLRGNNDYQPTHEFLQSRTTVDSLQSQMNAILLIEKSLIKERQALLKRQIFFTTFFLHLLSITTLAILIISYFHTLKQAKIQIKTEASEKELQSLLKQTPVAIVLYEGADLKIKVANAYALSLWGMVEKDVIGKKIEEIAIVREKILSIKKVYQTGVSFEGKELRFSFESDSRFYDETYTPWYGVDGKIKGVLTVCTDVTDGVLTRKKVEESEQWLKKAVEERTKELQQKNDFTETLLDSSVDIVIVLDKEMRFILLNKKARGIYSKFYPNKGIIGKKVDEVNTNVHETGAYGDIQNAFEGKTVQRKDFKSAIDDRFYDIDYVPIKNQQEVYAVMCILRDVTETVLFERKLERANRLLQEQYEFVETIINAAQEWIVVYNKERGISMLNDSCARMIGVNKEDVVGKKLDELCPDAKGSKLEADINKALNGEYVYNEPFISPLSHRWTQNYITPLKDSNGNIYAALSIAQDVTDIIRSQEELKKSQRHFALLFNVSPVAITIFRASDGNIIDVNPAWENLFDKKKTNVIGKSAEEIGLFDLKERAEWVREILRSGGEIRGVELKFQLNDEKIIYTYASFVTLELDEAKYFLGTYFDIGQRKAVEQKLDQAVKLLAEKNLELEEAQRLAHIGSWEMNISENKLSWSNELYNIFGLRKEKFVTNYENYEKIIHPEDRDYVIQTMRQTYEKHSSFDFTHRIIRPDGTVRVVHERGEVFTDENDEPIRIAGTAQDITEAARMTAALEQQNADLEKMNQELSSFSYIASHDLQEPLHKIQLFSRRIVDSEINSLSEKGREYFDRMERSARRMQQLIEDLLNYSRTTNVLINLEKVDLNIVVEEVKENLKEKLITTHTTIHLSKLPLVQAIPHQMNQLFTNIITNSIKFAKREVPPVLVISSSIYDGTKENKVSHLQKSKYHKITIEDNGIGFEPSFNEQIFGLFQRLHGKSEYEGTGIGLAICKKILENHNGTIVAHGKKDKGATFEFYIPV